MTISNTISNCIYYEIYVFNYKKGFRISIVLIFWSANQNRTHAGHRAAALAILLPGTVVIRDWAIFWDLKNATNWNILITYKFYKLK
jgi:hypothetical protein